jgi:isocitrate dehydrogenase
MDIGVKMTDKIYIGIDGKKEKPKAKKLEHILKRPSRSKETSVCLKPNNRQKQRLENPPWLS